VRITDEAITAAAELSDRYVTDRFLPDKAIDLIDQASARVRLRQPVGSDDAQALREEIDQLEREKEQVVSGEDYERAAELKRRLEDRRRQLERQRDGHDRAREVTAEDLAEVVARATGIPVAQQTEEERDRLLGLERRLHERVAGQDEPVRAVAEAVRRNRAGLGDPDRPVGSFLFLGPTGVGKTELARALAEALFGDEDLMVRLDMSEYQERHAVARLVGVPPMVLDGSLEAADRVDVSAHDGQLRFAVDKGGGDGEDGLGRWEEPARPSVPVMSGPATPRT
jgi:ATP-dependent Clp protease ATP-binding subunit ClpC